jgi:hypothetical protein
MEQKQEETPIPATEIKVTIGPNNYTIKRPNIGQIIDIEKTKLKLSGGTHSQMLFGTQQAMEAYLLVDAVSVFSILLPDLTNDMVVKSLLELTQEQADQLIKCYEDQVFPWLQQLRNVSSKK